MKYVFLLETGKGIEPWNQLSKLCKWYNLPYNYIRKRANEKGWPVKYKGISINKKEVR